MIKLTGEKQRAYHLLRERGLSITDAATACGVGYLHMRNALYGDVRPRPEVREKLPAFLGVDSAEQCFDSGSLSAAHDGRRGYQNRKSTAVGAV